jgi:hypothetical protein
MLMEPDELPPPEYSVVRSESRVVRQYSSSPQFHHYPMSGGFVPMIPQKHATVSRVENYEPEVIVRSERQNPIGAEQNFFSFFRNSPSSSSSHSRPLKSINQNQNQNTAASIAGRYSSAQGRANNFDQSILGSGDFSVIRGGTFYPEDERPNKYKDDYYGFKNGHSRPNAQPLKQPYYPEDPFENFKDFADINADPAFSHFVVIYENKNATKPHPNHPSPKNIFEQLQLLDLEKEENEKENVQHVTSSPVRDENDYVKNTSSDDKKLMKLSKYKSKLAKTKVVKKYKKKLGPKIESQSLDYSDPLLATS